MGFSFDELTKKAKDVASMAADRTKDAAEQVKINVAIAGEQREIEKNYRIIGEWFVNEFEGEIPEAVKETVEAVNTSKAKIAELENQLYALGFRKVTRWPIGVSVITNTGPEALAVMYYGAPRG